MSKAALMYCCQGSPGAGHVQRALALAEEFSEQFEVTMLLNDPAPNSVTAPDGVELVYLQPLEENADSSLTRTSDHQIHYQSLPARRDVILKTFDRLRPRVVTIDNFPLRQYSLRGEYLPLIRRARDRCYGETLVACVTDNILAEDLQYHDLNADKAAEILNRFFDIVIVRSDRFFARLDEFFRPKNSMLIPLYHCGFVKQRRTNLLRRSGKNREGILVSAGNEPTSTVLLEIAIEAHRVLQQTMPMRMTIIAGKRMLESDWQALQLLAEGLPNLSLKRVCPDLATEMVSARWSVSHCDYNAAVDAIRTRTPSLFIPDTEKNGREQIERAKRLVYWGAGRLLMPRHLNTASLVNEIHQLTNFEQRPMNFDLNGASNSAELIAQIVYQNNYSPVSTRPSTDTRIH